MLALTLVVSSGIFSRRFLMTLGLVEGTCIQYVKEAKKRGMGIVIFDPNVNSEREGMAVSYLFTVIHKYISLLSITIERSHYNTDKS